MKRLLIIIFLTIPAHAICQNENPTWPGTFVSGYEETVHGGGFGYHSSQPDVTSAMLIRSLISTDYIEWKTAKLPAEFSGEFAYFVWLFGIDANNGVHHFQLSVNGSRLLTFSNPPSPTRTEWRVDGADSSSLTFIPTLKDRYNDVMGYAILKLRRDLIASDSRQTIRISGENAGSTSWYMTFEAQVEENIEVKQIEALLKKNDKILEPVEFDFVHLGKATAATVTLPGGIIQNFTIEPGYNSFQIDYPQVDTATQVSAKIAMDGKAISKKITLNPIRKWTVYLVEHTHTDVGYTRPQNEIMAAHLRYIDEALDFCDETDKYPDAAKFHWTCETAWAVREYLRTRPEKQIERLLARVKEGRIEVTGLFLNMSDLLDEPTVANMMETIKEFESHGIPVRTAMQDDVNGAAWCLPDYLASAGVKYFTMGQNTDRALEPFNRPTAFWWESPSGSKVLAYRGEHYMYADNLGILNGDMGSFSENLFRYLKSLEGKGYPYDRTMLQFLGYYTDNAPPSIKACDLVREWNEKYEWPKLELTTIGEYFDYIAKDHSADLPTYRLAWPDWWIDGFGSAENETAHVRDEQAEFIADQGLVAMAQLLGAKPKPALSDNLRTINESNVFYDEHTFGAAESISDPLSYNSTVQWNEKRAFAWNSYRLDGILENEAIALLRPYLPASTTPTATVFNTMSFKRSGVTDAFIFNGMLPAGNAFKIVDQDGNDVPAQLLARRAEGNYWALNVTDVPAFGYKSFKIEASTSPAPTYPEQEFHGKLENKFYTIEFDTTAGAIRSVIDKSNNLQIVDTGAPWKLGEFIYETLPDREGISRHLVDHYTRTSMNKIEFGKIIDGPVWTSVDITGQLPQCADSSGITCEVRLYKQEKQIELVYSMKKKEVLSPEGAYVAFPFSMAAGQISFEAQGGTVVPGRDQLPGSASDWDGVQNFATVRGGAGQIVISSPEIPIMEFGDINVGKFQEVSSYEKPYIYSWVLNNYWTTNFVASQEGGMEWRYEITSTADTSIGFADDFGWGSRVPLVATTNEGSSKGSEIGSKSFLDFGNPDLMLVLARPAWDGNGDILYMREKEGKGTKLDITQLLKPLPGKSVIEVNSLQEKIGHPSSEITFSPNELKIIRIK